MPNDTTRWRLALARRLLHRAEAVLADASPFAAAESVIAAQDAVELTLWAIADANGYVTKAAHKLSFVDLIMAVPSAVEHKLTLDALNGLRVQAKHHGSEPDRGEAGRLVRAASTALTMITRTEPPHVDIATVYLASFLRHRVIAACLIDGEKLVADDERRLEFARALGLARYFIVLQAKAALGLGQREPHTPWSDFRRYDGKDRELARLVERAERRLDERISDVEGRLAEGSLFGDRKHAMLIEQLVPPLRLTGAGEFEADVSEGALKLLAPERRESVLLALVGAAEQADRLDLTHSALQPPDDVAHHVAVVKPTEARVSIAGEDRVIAVLVPGERYAIRLRGPEDVSLEIFGVDAMAAAHAFDRAAVEALRDGVDDPAGSGHGA